ncbi:Ig-like domain-containing protein [Paenibacillus sp. GCM10027626]|uniref:Ig-like domain-containing protein n=1 Tax=Paenibacillus sp. GCM10027626 TaxID=3273411 RepID=UPI003641025E
MGNKRKFNRFLSWLLSCLLLVALLPGVTAQASSELDKTTRTYRENNENFMNPERGFMYNYSPGDPYYAADQSRLKGYSIAYWNIKLDEFRTKPISAQYLKQIEEQFQAVRKAGIKVVLRFSYDSTAKGNDAALSVVLGHIEQLKPLLAQNSDVIAVLQAGFIGAWGEWHSSANNLTTTSNALPILKALLNALPENRMIQMRTPMKKEELLPNNGIPLQPEEAFSGSDRARVGHHNDCFISSATDVGTYPAKEIERWKSYISADTRYTPHGGETCDLSPYSTSKNAILEMERLHTSYLSSEYFQPVYSSWKSEGAFEEISRRMGYRIVLDDAAWTTEFHVGQLASIELNLRNVGFASMFNERPVFLVLDNGKDRYNIPLAGVDPRFWAAGEKTHVETQFSVPENVKPGDYQLALWLPDEAAALQNRPEYAVRLANEKIWDAGKGYNLLSEQVKVAPKEEGPKNPPKAENMELFTTAGTAVEGKLIGSSENQNPLTFSIVSEPSLGKVTLLDNHTGAFIYTPKSGKSGTDSFTFRAFDGQQYSGTATVVVKIIPNMPPIAEDAAFTVAENGQLNGFLTAKDENGDPLRFSLVSTGKLGKASIKDKSTGTFTYTPKSGKTGLDTFTFRVSDGHNYSAVATVTVTIIPVPPPTAQNQTITTKENKAVNGTLLATDAEGKPLKYSIVSNGKLGKAVLTDSSAGSFTYTPKFGKSGADSFTFRVFNGQKYSNIATVFINIEPAAVNRPPVAFNAMFNTTRNSSVKGKLSAADRDGDPLKFSIVSNGRLGTATLINSSTGAFIYTPKSGKTGTDTFTFRVHDGQSYSDIAKVTIQVTKKRYR